MTAVYLLLSAIALLVILLAFVIVDLLVGEARWRRLQDSVRGGFDYMPDDFEPKL